MGKGIASAALPAALLLCLSAASGADTFVFGGNAGWRTFSDRRGVVEASGVRGGPALTLSSARQAPGNGVDLSLSFDGPKPADAAGRYAASMPTSVSVAGPLRARAGSGAALFSGAEGGITVEPVPGSDALFRPGRRLDDFSIEFWLYPANLENGEQILSWNAARRSASGESVFQRVRCLVARNRIEWTFADFFASTDERKRPTVVVSGRAAPVPRTWSHHLVRFDADLGLLEYLVDGRLENVAYATSSGGERGERFTPVVGSGGSFSLGPRFTGMIDEFRVSGTVAEAADLSRFPREGGRAVSAPLDLGTTNAGLLGLEAVFSAPGASEARFFVRAGENPYSWKDEAPAWVPVLPGKPIPGGVRGRWAQISVVLYPDGPGETAPFVDSLRLTYERDEAPPPPSLVAAAARDGAVDLKWRPSPDEDLGGYLIYFGESAGEYFGESAVSGKSPIDVGPATSFVVDGLRDGRLYYFAVAAYDRASPRHIGEFSRETAARPARTVR